MRPALRLDSPASAPCRDLGKGSRRHPQHSPTPADARHEAAKPAAAADGQRTPHTTFTQHLAQSCAMADPLR